MSLEQERDRKPFNYNHQCFVLYGCFFPLDFWFFLVLLHALHLSFMWICFALYFMSCEFFYTVCIISDFTRIFVAFVFMISPLISFFEIFWLFLMVCPLFCCLPLFCLVYVLYLTAFPPVSSFCRISNIYFSIDNNYMYIILIPCYIYIILYYIIYIIIFLYYYIILISLLDLQAAVSFLIPRRVGSRPRPPLHL